MVSFFKHIHCASPGRSFMYNLAGNLLNKVVYNFWLRLQAKLLFARKQSNAPINLGGDGKYDSPGISSYRLIRKYGREFIYLK